MRYVGKCPSCKTEEDSLVWLRNTGNTSTHCCKSCEQISDITFSFDVKTREESKEILNRIQIEGVRITQHRPRYFSGFYTDMVYVRNMEELLEVDWVKRHMSEDFKHFAISRGREQKQNPDAKFDITDDWKQSHLMAITKDEHWVVGYVMGDISVLGLPEWNEDTYKEQKERNKNGSS
jgi:hypothetical protein